MQMQENKSLLLKSAMEFGFGMGCYWVFKYLFFMFSLQVPLLSSLYWGLTIMVPYIAYRLTKRYRMQLGGQIGFFHAWQFGILLYFFAALIVSLVHYGFYRYIAPTDFLTNSINEAIGLLQNSQIDNQLIQSLQEIKITPIQMAIQGIFNNLFYGIIFSIPVAALLCRNNVSGQISDNR